MKQVNNFTEKWYSPRLPRCNRRAGGEAVANNENSRLQLIFDEKPSAEQREVLKQNGFHWSPTEQAWQRLLNNNAIYAASRIDFLRPENGESPTELQPKVPSKNEYEC